MSTHSEVTYETDAEVDAMATVYRALKDIPREAHERIFDWVQSRLAAEEHARHDAPPAVSSPAEHSKP